MTGIRVLRHKLGQKVSSVLDWNALFPFSALILRNLCFLVVHGIKKAPSYLGLRNECELALSLGHKTLEKRCCITNAIANPCSLFVPRLSFRYRFPSLVTLDTIGFTAMRQIESLFGQFFVNRFQVWPFPTNLSSLPGPKHLKDVAKPPGHLKSSKLSHAKNITHGGDDFVFFFFLRALNEVLAGRDGYMKLK